MSSYWISFGDHSWVMVLGETNWIRRTNPWVINIHYSPTFPLQTLESRVLSSLDWRFKSCSSFHNSTFPQHLLPEHLRKLKRHFNELIETLLRLNCIHETAKGFAPEAVHEQQTQSFNELHFVSLKWKSIKTSTEKCNEINFPRNESRKISWFNWESFSVFACIHSSLWTFRHNWIQ